MPDQRAVLFHDGKVLKVLGTGRYVWQVIGLEYEISDVAFEYKPKRFRLETLRELTFAAETWDFVPVSDSQLCLHFRDGLFIDVLKAGIHAFWKSHLKHTFTMVDLKNIEPDQAIDPILFLKPELRDVMTSYAVAPWEAGMLYVDQVFQRTLKPGNYFFWKGSRSVSMIKVDLRQLQTELTGQEILTKDKIPLRINFFCQYKVSDVNRYAETVQDFEKQFHVLLQILVREYVSAFSLDELLEKKTEIGEVLAERIKPKAERFGIIVDATGLKDIILPGEIRDILNQVLIAEKKSLANVVMRREETASTRSLLNTAKLLDENATLYRLKELEYIERISEKISTISLNGGGALIEELKKVLVGVGRSS